MKHNQIFFFAGAALAMALASCATKALDNPVDYSEIVNPFVGTDYTGNTYPGAQLPFGMVQLSPDNGLPGWDRIAGYFYPDSTIAGFSHTHLSGTGAGDLYDISFLPVTFPLVEADAPLGVHSKFSHDSEQAAAGFYKVRLDSYGIDVELTATERTGIQRYTFPGGQAAVRLNLTKAMNWDATVESNVEIVDSVTIQGWRFSTGWASDQRLWFRTRFSEPWDSVVIGDVATFYFDTKPGQQITVTTALSCTGLEGAAKNLQAEAPTDDFDRYREEARSKWNAELSKIVVAGGTRDDSVKFYTALYHSMLAPTIYCDVDGAYRGPDKMNHDTGGWINYSTFSLWDTYRAAHPLYTYVAPERATDMVRSFVAFAEQNGRMPVWNFQGVETDMMIGYHSVPVIVEAYRKGLVPDSLARRALELSVATAELDDYRQIGLYRELGYVPYDAVPLDKDGNWSMSKTLEYAYDDYCIAQLAADLGEKEIADRFTKRSLNYRNTFNPASGFFQPRSKTGEFIAGFSPDDYSEHICESNAWQYCWSVQHAIGDLERLLGGSDAFAKRLQSMMTATVDSAALPIFSTGMIGHYAHGNEPGHHVIYLHNRAGRPDLTAKYVAQVMEQFYGSGPAGLCGNEDCGQMSAWFVFSAMGFYPVDPVSGVYEIGTPLFDRMELKLANGKRFTVIAKNLSKENIYVESLKLNGRELDKRQITHDDIMAGSTLELQMAPLPCY